jgi:uncharacterized membrane protein
MKRHRQVYFFVLSAATVWCGLLVLPPILMRLDADLCSVAGIFYSGFSHICHQLDSHSLHLFGSPLAVCARCTGIYFGFLAGVSLVPLVGEERVRDFRVPFLFGLLPMLADVALDGLGILGSSTVSRLATGGIFGITVGILLTPILLEGIEELVQQSIHRFVGVHPSNPSEG